MAHVEPRLVGDVEVIPLCDAVGVMGEPLRLPVEETFPGATPHDWSGLSRDEWVLHFHCYVLRAGGRVALVDTGIGDEDSPAASWAPVPGMLARELTRAGIPAADIDVIVLTHLHSDHASGAVQLSFPNARHVLQRAEVDAASPQTRDTFLRPLAGRLDVVDGVAEVLPGVRVRLAPGHTPGHQIVEAGELTLTGDLLHHPVQLVDPRVGYVYDDDPVRATATRMEVLDRVRAAGGWIAPAHFAEAFVRVPPGTGRARP
jgi:glyoxylase-like metal-dependent hydrolase (beta-lactamase superfamily II)